MHGKMIEYELLIKLCLFSTIKANGKKKKKFQQWNKNLSYYLYNVVYSSKHP